MSVSPRGPRRQGDLDRLDAALDVLVGALDRQIRRFQEGGTAGEEDLTSALVASTVAALDGIQTFGIQWTATVLTRGEEEPRHGADLLFILDLRLPTCSVAKGFLAQAKIVSEGRRSPADRAKLVEQCRTMLSWSSAAFVWVYSQRDGLRVYPAMSVVAADGRLDELNYMPIRDFLSEHFNCFVGDRSLGIQRRRDVDRVIQEYAVGRAVIVRAGFDTDAERE